MSSYGGYSHGAAQDRTERDLTERRPFKRSGYNMWATDGRHDSFDTGVLPAEWRNRWLAADIVYTVVSYRTPIAWVTRSGDVVIPDVKYSLTTTQHQWACKLHLTSRGA